MECFCSVVVGLKDYWKNDEFLQGLITASDDKTNRFFEDGLARGSNCNCYVVAEQVGSTIPSVSTDSGTWSTATYRLTIYCKSRQVTQRIKDYLRSNLAKKLCSICVPGGSFSNMKVTASTDEILRPDNYRVASVSFTGRLYQGDCDGSGYEPYEANPTS